MRGGGRAGVIAATAVVLLTGAGLAAAQDAGDPSESAFHWIARKAGVAMTPPPPPDFVVQSRPSNPGPALPLFGQPPEPPSKVMAPADLKAMGSDLSDADKQHDELRATYPPSAKAVAEQKAGAAKKPKPAAAATPEGAAQNPN